MVNPAEDLQKDPLLQTAPSCEGFKVLEPAVLYAKIGAGGMGAVYRGRHFSLECDVAVKVLRPELALDEQFVSRFAREAKLAARISNDNVVRVLDVKEKNGIHYLVMEFVKGETARERVKRKGPLKEAEALAILVGATNGLREAHAQGIVHRDIKPDNVLVAEDGRIKLADLGLAKAKQNAGEQNLTVLSSGVMGTPQYMPPEQWRTPDVSPAADVWALGATLYYLLAGKSGIPSGEMLVIAEHIRDHDFPSILLVRPDVRPEVAALLAKCTAKKPEQRFADARELLKELRPLVTIDDDLLRDPAAGSSNSSAVLVTPPPRATLARIKLQVQENPDEVPTRVGASPVGTGSAASSAVASSTELRPPGAVVSPAGPAVAPRPISRSHLPWLITALVVVGTAVGGGYAAGWFGPVPLERNEVAKADAPIVPATQPAKPAEVPAKGDTTSAPKANTDTAAPTTTPTVPTNNQPANNQPANDSPGNAPPTNAVVVTPPAAKPPVEAPPDPAPTKPVPVVVEDPAVAAKAALARGLEALPRSGGLETAIVEFEQALRLDATLAQAKQSLVLGLVRKQKQLATSDPDAAYDAAQRARELAPDDGDVQAAVASAVASLQQRMAAAVTLRTPVVDAVVGELTIKVEGSANVPNVRTVRVAIDANEAGGAGMPFPLAQATTAPVVGGVFEALLQAKGDGPQLLRVQVEDVRGPLGEMVPRGIVVDTKAPDLTMVAPAEGALVAAVSEFVVRVQDGSPTTVRIAGQNASRQPDGSFVARVTLADGAADVAVEATDATGRVGTAKRSVRVDAKPPVVEVAPGLPPLTKDKELRIRGVVRDANTTTLTAAGNGVRVAADGAFEAVVAFAESRAYEVALVATDVVGNVGQAVVQVRHDGVPPVLAFGEPIAATVLAGPLQLTGSVTDDSVCEVLVNAVAVPVQDGRWSASLTVLANAELVVTVTARDAAGNEAEPLRLSVRGEQPLVELPWAVAAPGCARITIGELVYPSVVVEKQTQLRMVLVPAAPAGFTMGSASGEAERGEDETSHQRVIGRAFWLGETEVTQTQWQTVMGNNPSKRPAADRPVDSVSWNDCQQFVQKLNASSGGFRLPSEAEWEYACRAGTTTPFALGTAVTPEQVNYDGSRPYAGAPRGTNRKQAVPAGSLPANTFGLFEMHGNVYEWCEDKYAPYPGTGTEQPVVGDGPRVVRGGAWGSMASGCRSAFRFGSNEPWTKSERIGLRLARSL